MQLETHDSAQTASESDVQRSIPWDVFASFQGRPRAHVRAGPTPRFRGFGYTVFGLKRRRTGFGICGRRLRTCGPHPCRQIMLLGSRLGIKRKSLHETRSLCARSDQSGKPEMPRGTAERYSFL
jgi:hypothetical protein